MRARDFLDARARRRAPPQFGQCAAAFFPNASRFFHPMLNFVVSAGHSTPLLAFRVSPRALIAAALLFALALWLALIFFARQTAASWIDSESPRVAAMIEKNRAAAAADRLALWRASLDSLQDEIAALNVRLWRLENSAARAARHLDLPADVFPPNEGGIFRAPPNAIENENEAKTEAESEVEATATATAIKTSAAPAAAAPDSLAADFHNEINVLDRSLARFEKRFSLIEISAAEARAARGAVPMERPLGGRSWFASGYGRRKDPFTGRRAFHSGHDFAARKGTPVFAAADGIVVYRGRLGNYGRMIEVYHGDGVSTLYGHLSGYDTKALDYVRRGETIGFVGSSGRSTGPHLHYEVREDGRPRPPRKFIRELKKRRGIKESARAGV